MSSLIDSSVEAVVGFGMDMVLVGSGGDGCCRCSWAAARDCVRLDVSKVCENPACRNCTAG